jgi:hypothetical protein
VLQRAIYDKWVFPQLEPNAELKKHVNHSIASISHSGVISGIVRHQNHP